MNYRRGLLRLWVGLSLIWFVWVWFTFTPFCRLVRLRCEGDYDVVFVVVALGGPTLMGLVALLLVWIISGFRK